MYYYNLIVIKYLINNSMCVVSGTCTCTLTYIHNYTLTRIPNHCNTITYCKNIIGNKLSLSLLCQIC